MDFNNHFRKTNCSITLPIQNRKLHLSEAEYGNCKDLSSHTGTILGGKDTAWQDFTGVKKGGDRRCVFFFLSASEPMVGGTPCPPFGRASGQRAPNSYSLDYESRLAGVVTTVCFRPVALEKPLHVREDQQGSAILAFLSTFVSELNDDGSGFIAQKNQQNNPTVICIYSIC